MKILLLISFFLLSAISFCQTQKDSLFKADIEVLVEELEFMYGYDQTLREYTFYKTFDKSETNRVEALSDSLRAEALKEISFTSDSLVRKIFKYYINPQDALHTQRVIDITKKYGFPSSKRIKQFYNQEFEDPEFNPIIILIHSPKEFWEELKVMMKNEYQNGDISQCDYGYLLWQFSGRKSFKPMLDNGFEMVEKDGRSVLTSTCD
ncbi:hypothetical protein [Gillisia sp. Hel_I_29]|uniref:hypothetical protein n=1 Tax=Gillisia sp. Hel_I_29 TaxID=1249975 RepID=UPI0005574141|nr:hypothetical protein [Gillisia sp. Hel_I_29]